MTSDDTSSYKKIFSEHGEKLAVQRVEIDHLEQRMDAQTKLMEEVKDGLARVHGVVLGGMGLITIVGIIIGIIVAFK